MNATSLYVSTCRLILQADSEDPNSWTDLYRLVPYLRQSLSCTVCGNLLIEPHTPTELQCQHHVCRNCKGGRKKLKPSCCWCRDYEKYEENVQLRILLQCYKKLCEYLMSTAVYRCILLNIYSLNNSNGLQMGSAGASNSLAELIQEGAGFKDNFKSNAGLSKSAYSILPCVYTSTISTQTQASNQQSLNNDFHPRDPVPTAPIKTVSNGSSIYSVMYAGSGNKITIKRKTAVVEENNLQPESNIQVQPPNSVELVNCITASQLYNDQCLSKKQIKTPKSPNSFKKPRSSSSRAKRKGCRCGNATAVPGKLTCCGQRCPCYVESKPCIECRCRGCRNPHTPEGIKIRPHIPELENLQLQLSAPISCSEQIDGMQQCYTGPPSTIQVVNVYSTAQNVNSIPQTVSTVVLDRDIIGSTGSEADDSDNQMDV